MNKVYGRYISLYEENKFFNFHFTEAGENLLEKLKIKNQKEYDKIMKKVYRITRSMKGERYSKELLNGALKEVDRIIKNGLINNDFIK